MADRHRAYGAGFVGNAEAATYRIFV
ncbi:uncharacterized protein METZ01_LOCUS155092, partial [marine metagenome]